MLSRLSVLPEGWQSLRGTLLVHATASKASSLDSSVLHFTFTDILSEFFGPAVSFRAARGWDF